MQARERGGKRLAQRYRQRTPAMAAGRTNRRWTAREVLSSPLPPVSACAPLKPDVGEVSCRGVCVSCASRRNRMGSHFKMRRPVWTASSPQTGPNGVCRELVELSTISYGSTRLSLLWRLDWFPLRPSTSRGGAKRSTLHRLRHRPAAQTMAQPAVWAPLPRRLEGQRLCVGGLR
jgi:hypothetical protein